jgi:hypothetical protein
MEGKTVTGGQKEPAPFGAGICIPSLARHLFLSVADKL